MDDTDGEASCAKLVGAFRNTKLASLVGPYAKLCKLTIDDDAVEVAT